MIVSADTIGRSNRRNVRISDILPTFSIPPPPPTLRMSLFIEAHLFTDIAPHCPLQLTEAGLKYLLFPSLSLLSFVGGSSMPLLAEEG
jgi:hypothetical protein